MRKFKKNISISIIILFFSSIIHGCANIKQDSAGGERDIIYNLMAYAVVYEDWQSEDLDSRRGYNIGAVLVDPEGSVVHWGRNTIHKESDNTQHAEVRVMTQYTSNTEESHLKGYTIYTTLEPCAMCAGMMIMLQVDRTVFGQTALRYGKAVERISKCPLCPSYPRTVISDPSSSKIRKLLDSAYKQYLKEGGVRGIQKFLTTEEAKSIYENATKQFLNYEVKFPENEKMYKNAKSFYENIE